MKKFTVTLNPVEPTANTVKFAEALDESDYLATRVLGTVYVPKNTLRANDWQGGAIKLSIESA